MHILASTITPLLSFPSVTDLFSFFLLEQTDIYTEEACFLLCVSKMKFLIAIWTRYILSGLATNSPCNNPQQ